MKASLAEITKEENSRLTCRFIFAIVLYLATMGTYLGVFLAKEDEKSIRGLALLNPIFILASDVVVLSLRE